jgi:exodeoxyribonuclease V alpha subunit
MNENIDYLYRQQYLSALDLHFARFIRGLAGDNAPEVALAAALVSRWRGEGHVCLDLSIPAGKYLPPGTDAPVRCPELAPWRQILSESPVVGRPGEWKPLILTGSRLYLYRYWDYENSLAVILRQRMKAPPLALDEERLRHGLRRLFPSPTAATEIDWQKVAVFTAAVKSFTMISGGPGTGKTFTVAKILSLLSEQNDDQPLRIALTAPTGKAAARMQEALQEARAALPCPELVKSSLPAASTIHRLLGSNPHAPHPRYHEDNPLPVDIVVVDEGSMIDLALLSQLVQAIPASARLILLGDKDQLASIEAGAVFGDICPAGHRRAYSSAFAASCRHITGESIPARRPEVFVPPAADCHVELLRNYRFHGESGIAAVSNAVNEGDGPRALRVLKTAPAGDARWQTLPSPEDLPKSLAITLTETLAGYLTTTAPRDVFERFNRLRILCVLREGPYGVGYINNAVEEILHRCRIIRRDGPWYFGRPVLITSNDYTAHLYNGDIGIVLPDPEGQNEPRVFFPTPEGTFRKILPSRLGSYETVFAMTVHKSQGSEFDRVLCLLPDRDIPLLTRELIYTALTRARRGVTVWGREDVFLKAVSRRIERSSGLRDALWPADITPSPV